MGKLFHYRLLEIFHGGLQRESKSIFELSRNSAGARSKIAWGLQALLAANKATREILHFIWIALSRKIYVFISNH